jgi:enamine deaminase RidA (YjgF/YER057c/UK114 family)
LFRRHAGRDHPASNSQLDLSDRTGGAGPRQCHDLLCQRPGPPVASKDADPSSREAYGDTKAQTVGVLNRIKGILEGLGLTMGDVVKMQVFLVHSPSAPMDFKAFMEGYTQFFGGSQPNLPARSVVGVASLANPGFLVEIEVIAVKETK